MSTQHNDDEQTINLTRRQALKGAAVGTAAVGLGVNTPVNRVRAGWFDDDDDTSSGTPGLSVASPGLGLVSATAKVLGWTAGDSNQAAKAELRADAYADTTRYYRSVSRELGLTTDLLEYAPDGVFSDAKLKGIEQLNAGATQSQVETAMLDLARAEMTQLEKNVIESANQGMKTINNYLGQAIDNDIAPSEVATLADGNISDYYGASFRQVILIDGTSYEVEGINYRRGGSYDETSFAIRDDTSSGNPYGSRPFITPLVHGPDKNKYYPAVPIYQVDTSQWGTKPSNLPPDYDPRDTGATALQNLRNQVVSTWKNDLKPDIKTWAANAYDAYASGDVQPEDLLTATEIATTISDEEPANRAIAHLRSSGIGVKPDSPVTIETQAEGGTVTVKGAILGSTGTSASLSVGTTVNPSTISYDYTVNYVPGDVAIQWPHYTTTLDGGVLTVGQTPSTEVESWLGRPMQMVVQTSKGETATFDPYAYGSAGNPSAGFTVDLSGQLNEPIADATSLSIFSAKSEQVSATKILNTPFTLVDGAKDTYDFTHERSIQSTDNYITAEEWEQRNQELKKIIDELRDDGGGGGGGGGGGLFGGGPNIPSLPGLGVIESAVVVALSFAGLNALTS